MSTPETAFQKLLGRTPTDAERLDLYRVKDALGLPDQDSIWLILIALQYYLGLYGEIPERIRAATTEAVKAAKSAAEVEARVAAAEAKTAMAYVIAETAQKVARQVAGRRMAMTIAGAVIIAFATIGGALWGGWVVGKEQQAGKEQEAEARGYQRGLEEARMERAAAEWGASPEGRLAHELASAGTGNIEMLARCTGDGWQRSFKGEQCYPTANSANLIKGWQIPIQQPEADPKPKKGR